MLMLGNAHRKNMPTTPHISPPNRQWSLAGQVPGLSALQPEVFISGTIKKPAWLSLHCGATILLSTVLLFQLQPLIAKMILPWFGGSASVWTTCLLFFQLLLLLGYGYSHLLCTRLLPRRQGQVHIAVLLLAALCLPLQLNPQWRPLGDQDPLLRTALLLTVTVGLPYFALSTTTPLVQAWFSRQVPHGLSYRFFAISNAGSLVALLAYPLLVEPRWPLPVQTVTWSVGFGLFALLSATLAWRQRLHAPLNPAISAPVPARLQGLWVLLAACPSLLLVTDTRALTEDIAPVPLLWVLPLGLYLLSFVLCFDGRGWYRRWLFVPLAALGLLALACLPVQPFVALPIRLDLGMNLVSFFFVCMVCHGELAHIKPPANQLTRYYLMLAIGGACGGLLAGLVAPLVFQAFYEHSIALLLCAVSLSVLILSHSAKLRTPRLAWGLAGLLVLALAATRVYGHWRDSRDVTVSARDFYGAIQVVNGFVNGFVNGVERQAAYRSLRHGQIVHGQQFIDPSQAQTPTAYYGLRSGVARVFSARAPQTPLRIGALGLGVGTLAAFGQPGDWISFYEISPIVVAAARSEFSYLSASQARVDVVLGDARLSLEQQAPQQFDLLVLDAFAGDSVPTHLLTLEAFELYVRHLSSDGTLVIDVTNAYLNLAPVVKRVAEKLGLSARLIQSPGNGRSLLYPASWVVVTRNAQLFADPALKRVAREIDAGGPEPVWTDDYSSLFSVLK